MEEPSECAKESRIEYTGCIIRRSSASGGVALDYTGRGYMLDALEWAALLCLMHLVSHHQQCCLASWSRLAACLEIKLAAVKKYGG